MTAHPRNLTDEMIRTISLKGGVIGLNFCPRFLGTDKKPYFPYAPAYQAHYHKGGEDVLALGTDFDGITGTLQLKSCDELYLLADALKKHRMSERIIEKCGIKMRFVFYRMYYK